MSTHAAHTVAKSIHRLANLKEHREFLLREARTEQSLLDDIKKELNPKTVYVLNQSQVLAHDAAAGWRVLEAHQV